MIPCIRSRQCCCGPLRNQAWASQCSAGLAWMLRSLLWISWTLIRLCHCTALHVPDSLPLSLTSCRWGLSRSFEVSAAWASQHPSWTPCISGRRLLPVASRGLVRRFCPKASREQSRPFLFLPRSEWAFHPLFLTTLTWALSRQSAALVTSALQLQCRIPCVWAVPCCCDPSAARASSCLYLASAARACCCSCWILSM